MEEKLSVGEIKWSSTAEETLRKIAEMIPHFIRTKSVKKLQKRAEEFAFREKSEVNGAIQKRTGFLMKLSALRGASRNLI